MPGVTQPETFRFTWKVENFHLFSRKMGAKLSTLVFQVGVLENTMWQLQILPSGINDPLYMGCSLHRMSSAREQYEPEVLKLRWKIKVIAEGGTVRFEKHFQSIFKRKEFVNIPDFIRKSALLPTDTPQNNITIYCEMTKDSLFSSELDLKYDLEALSSDLTGLLESGFRSDFIMYCRGEKFNLHKFILLSRWPEFCQRLEIDDISTKHDIIMTGIEAATLKAFLTFLYSGKLQRDDISMELCSYMHEQYCDTLMASLMTPVSSLEFETQMHHEWKYLTWEVGDENSWKMCKTPFFRVIPLEEVYACEMVIIFSFEKRDGEEWLKLVAHFTGFTELRPILLDGEISFMNKGVLVCSRKFTHFMETREDWCFPWLVKKSDLLPNERNSKSIEIRLCISDGCLKTRQISANIDNASRFREVKDLRKLMLDLVNSAYEKDLNLKLGDRLYPVHSPIVAARSAKLRELIQDNDGIIEIEEDISKEASESFIKHLYGLPLLDMDIESKFSLNSVAKKFELSTLEERIRRMFE